MSGPRTEAGRAMLEAGHLPPCPWKSQGSMGRGDCDCPSRVVAIEDQAREPALALLRLLGADRACAIDTSRKRCQRHRTGGGREAFAVPDAARCTVGAEWDALEAP